MRDTEFQLIPSAANPPAQGGRETERTASCAQVGGRFLPESPEEEPQPPGGQQLHWEEPELPELPFRFLHRENAFT